MPIDDSILKDAEVLAAPVSAAEPSGKNPAADERYQELRVEVDKENSPTGEAVQWPRVAELGAQILQKVAKDLLVAAYTAYGLYKTRSLRGLAVGFTAVDLILEKHWDTMFPPLARIKGRGTAVRWLLEHAQAGLASFNPTAADRVALMSLIDASKSLRARARDKLGDHSPSFKDWTDLLESLRQTLPPEEAAPTPPASATVAAPAAPVPEDIFAEPAKPPPTSPPPAAPAAVPAAVPVAASPPEPQKPADDPRTLAAPWLNPLPGDKGSEAASTDEYQSVLTEVDKLQSPSGGAINWSKVVRDGDTVLQRHTKDLRIACHVALARFKTGRIAGLAVGLALVAELSDIFWDTMQPPVARIRGRVGALRGLLDLLEPDLNAYTPKPDDGPALVTLKQSAARLQAVTRARMADQAPNLRLLLQTVDQLIMTVKETAKPPPPPQAPPPEAKPAPVPETRPAATPPPQQTTAPASAPAAPIAAPAAVAGPGESTPAAVDKFLRGVGDEFIKLSGALRRAKTSDPLAYRLLRTGLYVYITAPPPAPKDDTTAIPALSDKDRGRLDAMRSNNRWAELLEASESLLPTNRYNLDLHRHSHDALQQLGQDHQPAAAALTAELASLLTRLPRLLALKFKEGAPLASPETRNWLDTSVLASKGGGSSSSAAPIILTAPSSAPAEPNQLLKLMTSDRENGLRVAAAQIQQAPSGRDRFLRRLELAEACAAGKDAPLARQLLTGLVADIDALHLDTWEPSLATRCFTALVRTIPKNVPAEKPALDAALARLASLDPFAATRP